MTALGSALSTTSHNSPTMRDALLSAITFDIFQRNAEKVGLAAVAQSINCLNSLMLAKEDKFTLTPVFHVFKMYLPHQGAIAVRTEFTASTIDNPIGNAPVQVGGNSYIGQIAPVRTLAGLSGSASVAPTGGGASAGKLVTLSVVNPHLDQPMTTEISVRGASITSATGSVLASPDVHDHNDFASPDTVKTAPAIIGSLKGGRLMQTFPPASVTVLLLSIS